VVDSACLPRVCRVDVAGVAPRGIWFNPPPRDQLGAPASFRVACLGVRPIPDESLLREKARAAIRTRKLPARRPDRTWGGAGIGGPCSVCELSVTRDELEFEIQFAHDGAVAGLDKVRLHVRCFAVWELERVVGPAKL
jgi:hypothetical protein